MKFKDLKEMKIAEWDGEPFKAYVCDDMDFEREVDSQMTADVVGFVKGFWLASTHWKHAYPVDWNEPKPKRMTNRQLAKWLAQGNGEYSSVNVVGAYQTHGYGKSVADSEVPLDTRVRTWDSEEWIEPTVDLIKEN